MTPRNAYRHKEDPISTPPPRTSYHAPHIPLLEGDVWIGSLSGRLAAWFQSSLCCQLTQLASLYHRPPQTMSLRARLATGLPGHWRAVDWPAVGNERTRQHAIISAARPNGRLSRLTKHETPPRPDPEGPAFFRGGHLDWSVVIFDDNHALLAPSHSSPPRCFPPNAEQRRSQICKRQLVLCLARWGTCPAMPCTHRLTLWFTGTYRQAWVYYVEVHAISFIWIPPQLPDRKLQGFLCGGPREAVTPPHP